MPLIASFMNDLFYYYFGQQTHSCRGHFCERLARWLTGERCDRGLSHHYCTSSRSSVQWLLTLTFRSDPIWLPSRGRSLFLSLNLCISSFSRPYRAISLEADRRPLLASALPSSLPFGNSVVVSGFLVARSPALLRALCASAAPFLLRRRNAEISPLLLYVLSAVNSS